MSDPHLWHPAWPLFGLRVRCGDLELRLPTDADLFALAEVAAAGIHPPEYMPFSVPWTDQPRERLQRDFVRFHWRLRADVAPEAWHLSLGVFHAGEPIGVQDVLAKDFAATRSVETASWLGTPFQGRGFGRRIRTAVLALAFEHLDAEEARSSAREDNRPSRRVSEILGYAEDGTERIATRGEGATLVRYRMDRDAWRAHEREPVTVDGVEPCRELLGA